MNYAERLQAKWTEKYAHYTVAMLARRINTLTRQIDTKRRSAENAKWNRRNQGRRLQSSREQKAHAAAGELIAERMYVELLFASRTTTS